jgi:3',5'-cyclic AMP phosphodiesterase CpdA
VLDWALRAVDALAPEAVIQGGDLTDNAQANELTVALAALRGGRVQLDSGTPGYVGVQSASNADPFYYRPDVDAPRHPGLLERAVAPLASVGSQAPWFPVLGDHDVLVQGVAVPSALTQAIAVGNRAVYELPVDLGADVRTAVASTATPDGLAVPGVLDRLLLQLMREPSVIVPADPRRRELSVPEAIGSLRAGSSRAVGGARARFLDYWFDVGDRVRVIVLDLARRGGGSGGVAQTGQAAWLADAIAAAGERWLLVVSHQPLTSTAGGGALLGVLDAAPRVLAAVSGHTHRNRIAPRPTARGGYWLVSTASLIDYPQQLRALRVVETTGGGVALMTWMLDHAPDGGIGDVSRQLAFIDVHGGRPQGFAGGREDRNATLFRGPPA